MFVGTTEPTIVIVWPVDRKPAPKSIYSLKIRQTHAHILTSRLYRIQRKSERFLTYLFAKCVRMRGLFV